MKRTALILLAAIYFISCVGMSVNRFYCCGKLASVNYTLGATADGNKSATKDKCCHHQNQSFKVKDSHLSASLFSLKHPLPAIVPCFINPDNGPIADVLPAKIVYKGNAPPEHSAIPVYALNCAYRI